jgi:hypothetical protein
VARRSPWALDDGDDLQKSSNLDSDVLLVSFSEEGQPMSVTACAPGLDVSIDFPDDWAIRPFQPNLDPFAFPVNAYTVGPYKLLSCAVTIQYWEWFRVTSGGDPSSAIILDRMFFAPDQLAERKVRLQSRTAWSVPGCDRAELATYETTVYGHPMKFIQLHAVRSEVDRGNRYWSIVNVSCAVLMNEYQRYDAVFSRMLGSVSCATESALGVCFEIERLERLSGNYARRALDIFLKQIDPKRLEL